jgi:hypothetical protein
LPAAIGLAVLPLLCCEARKEPWWVTPPLQTPNYHFKITGTVEPPLELRLNVVYSTREESCRVVVDRFAGAYSDQMYRHRLELRRNGRDFEASVALDLVVRGTCGWYPWGVEYVVLRDGRPHSVPIPTTPLFWFKEGGPETLAPTSVTCAETRSFMARGLHCDQSLGDHFVRPLPGSAVASFRVR